LIGIPVLVLAILGTWHWGRAVATDLRLAEQAVKDFHERFNSGAFELGPAAFDLAVRRRAAAT
jgi:hypothetical protein